ncbi:3-hydroxyacyl-[acyl-carrier-protein] dehydratase FabZ [Frankliniella fusca]|uniref:3-hydroxyacyl-[acyl-carrier-protein] dehydratase FabZ n=2 Tax=Frankliniella fusca TaxID=407009 RepID=A0AAE1L9A6_9NEOP|nr:3-hydroxyacyl-[acyl-carrier-protein] dehydratase FabZ [Frankliniella fusca]
MKNIIQKRSGISTAPLLVLNDDNTNLNLTTLLKEKSDLVVDRAAEADGRPLSLLEAFVASAVLVLSEFLNQRPGEAAGRPKKAKIYDVINVVRRAYAVLLYQNPPSGEAVPDCLYSLKAKGLVEALPHQFAYRFSSRSFEILSGYTPRDLTMSQQRCDKHLMHRMEEALIQGKLVAIFGKELEDAEIAAAKRVASLQKRKFVLFPAKPASLVSSKNTWPVIVLKSSQTSLQVMKNIIQKRSGISTAPLLVLNDDNTNLNLTTLLKEKSDLVVDRAAEADGRPLSLLEAFVASAVLVLSEFLNQRPGEAAGRPKKAKIYDVINVVRRAYAVLLYQNPPSGEAVPDCLYSLKAKGLVEALPHQFAYRFSSRSFEILSGYTPRDLTMSQQRCDKHLMHRMEEALIQGKLVAIFGKELEDAEIAAAKRVASLQKRKFVLFPAKPASLVSSKNTWPVIVLKSSQTSLQVMKNIIQKRSGISTAPLLVLNDDNTNLNLTTLLKEKSDLVVDRAAEADGRPLSLLEAFVASAVLVLSEFLNQRPGEAAGRPKKAKIYDVINVVRRAYAVLLYQNPPSGEAVPDCLYSLKAKGLVEALPHQFAYRFSVSPAIFTNAETIEFCELEHKKTNFHPGCGVFTAGIKRRAMDQAIPL